MLWNLLDDETATTVDGNNNYLIWILIIVIVVFAIYMLFSNRKGKQRQQEYTEMMDAIAPGNKVKTVGGICGIVVEVCDDNTVIVQTGSEQSGKSTFKIDKDSIAQTDAKGPTQIAREEAEARRAAEKAAKKQGNLKGTPSEEVKQVKIEAEEKSSETAVGEPDGKNGNSDKSE